ncbi:MAG: PstS family phosphate ABC transporter substrate-binding protein, partial [Methermicoccaceae archaeon]
MKSIYLLAAVAVMLSSVALGCTSPQTESELGEVVIKGSDTMVQMVSNLAEGYMEKYPDRKVAVTGGGSGTGIAALLNGEVDIADASRLMKDREIEQARAKGIEPVRFIIARDALSVIVNPNNPVDALTIEQISDIYAGNITNWKEVGGPDMEITLYGRQSTSGTYAYFLEEVVNQQLLGKRLNREYSPKMLNMEGNTAIVDAVARDVSGIGYIGVGYLRDDVKPIGVAKTPSDEYVSPS